MVGILWANWWGGWIHLWHTLWMVWSQQEMVVPARGSCYDFGKQAMQKGVCITGWG